MSSEFSQDPLEKLAHTLRAVTPSLNDQFFTSEAVTARAEQIAKELVENLQPILSEEDELFLVIKQFSEENKALIQSEQDKLSMLQKTSQATVNKEQYIIKDVEDITKQVTTDLETFITFLKRFEDLQRERMAQEAEKNYVLEEILNGIRLGFDPFTENFSRAARNRPLKQIFPQTRPTKEDIAKQARFLAEVQLGRDILKRQRQEQIKEARIVFYVALALLCSGVLLVFAGVLGIYIFNLTAGTITAISGTIIDITSAIVLQFNKQEKDRVEKLAKELSILDRMSTAIELLSYVSDTKKKEQAIIDLVKQLHQ